MHASIWTFRGDPDELLRGYDAMVAEIPSANMKLHLCLRAPDGIVIVDTCPTKEVFDAFDDFPVHVAFVNSGEHFGASR